MIKKRVLVLFIFLFCFSSLLMSNNSKDAHDADIALVYPNLCRDSFAGVGAFMSQMKLYGYCEQNNLFRQAFKNPRMLISHRIGIGGWVAYVVLCTMISGYAGSRLDASRLQDVREYDAWLKEQEKRNR